MSDVAHVPGVLQFAGFRCDTSFHQLALERFRTSRASTEVRRGVRVGEQRPKHTRCLPRRVSSFMPPDDPRTFGSQWQRMLRSDEINDLRLDIRILRTSIDAALDRGVGSDDISLRACANLLRERRKRLTELERAQAGKP